MTTTAAGLVRARLEFDFNVNGNNWDQHLESTKMGTISEIVEFVETGIGFKSMRDVEVEEGNDLLELADVLLGVLSMSIARIGTTKAKEGLRDLRRVSHLPASDVSTKRIVSTCNSLTTAVISEHFPEMFELIRDLLDFIGYDQMHLLIAAHLKIAMTYTKVMTNYKTELSTEDIVGLIKRVENRELKLPYVASLVTGIACDLQDGRDINWKPDSY